MMQDNGHYTIQRHSRSPILVQIEHLYAASSVSVLVTYLLSCTISKIWRTNRAIFHSRHGGASV